MTSSAIEMPSRFSVYTDYHTPKTVSDLRRSLAGCTGREGGWEPYSLAKNQLKKPSTGAWKAEKPIGLLPNNMFGYTRWIILLQIAENIGITLQPFFVVFDELSHLLKVVPQVQKFDAWVSTDNQPLTEMQVADVFSLPRPPLPDGTCR